MAGGEGCRHERRGSSASEVGTVDGIATTKKEKKKNHGLGYSSVDREKVHKLQSTGYQNSHQTKGDISVPPPSIVPPRLSLSRIHKRNSHLKCFDVS